MNDPKYRLSTDSRAAISSVLNGSIDLLVACDILANDFSFIESIDSSESDYIIGLSSELEQFPLGTKQNKWNKDQLIEINKILDGIRSTNEERLISLFRKFIGVTK